MKTYVGVRRAFGCQVFVLEGRDALGWLNPRFDLRRHSPDGFEWGYGGSGPAQLALALLADAGGSDRLALAMYQSFKAEVVANLPHDGWILARDQVMPDVSVLIGLIEGR